MGAVRDGWRRLRGGELTRRRAAASVALGLFVGCLPLYGFHFWICLLVAIPLRLDFPLAYLVANLSNPIVAPFLIALEIEVGSFVRQGRWVRLSPDLIREHGWSGAFRDLAVGSVLVGAAIAAAGAGLAAALVQRSPEKSELDLAMRRTVDRFRRCGPAVSLYVRSKLAYDPGPRMIATLTGLGAVVDLGCGRGQLSVLLLELGCAERVRAIDWDAKKVEYGRVAAEKDQRMSARTGALAIEFEAGDVREVELGDVDTVLLVDTLHYLTPADQDRLLDRVAACLRPGGRVIVREADGSGGLRARATRALEILTTRLGYNLGDRVAIRPITDIARSMERSGLVCEALPASRGTPFANVLLVASRPDDDAPDQPLSPFESVVTQG
jgi:uncharacterized protein (DUF2062 family)/2-polyprenyl-3-methyl-5-hydroxy-6-metoxy-1,4-benzoquinol methylase